MMLRNGPVSFGSWFGRPASAVRTACILLALAALAPLPAQAQQTLVSNLAGVSDNTATELRNTPASQPFVTGDETYGYTLHSVVLHFGGQNDPAIQGDEFEVTVRANGANDQPGGVLYRLINPPSVERAGENEFTASSRRLMAPGLPAARATM